MGTLAQVGATPVPAQDVGRRDRVDDGDLALGRRQAGQQRSREPLLPIDRAGAGMGSARDGRRIGAQERRRRADDLAAGDRGLDRDVVAADPPAPGRGARPGRRRPRTSTDRDRDGSSCRDPPAVRARRGSARARSPRGPRQRRAHSGRHRGSPGPRHAAPATCRRAEGRGGRPGGSPRRTARPSRTGRWLDRVGPAPASPASVRRRPRAVRRRVPYPRSPQTRAASSRSRISRVTPSTGTRSWAIESRSRTVTAPSSSESTSTVTHQGVPISSWRR